MTGFRTMAVLAVAGLMLTACASRSMNDGNDQGYGDYGSNVHRQPYKLYEPAPAAAPAKDAHGEAPAADAAAGEAPAAEAPAAGH